MTKKTRWARLAWRTTLAVLVPAASVLAREEYTRHFDKSVSVRSGGRVIVENKFGDIVIRTRPGSEAAIHADIRVSASNTSEAQRYAGKVEILVEESPDLSIRTRYPETERHLFGMNNVSFSVRYELTLPENSPLDVHNAFGAVSATGVQASSEITTSHGELHFRNGRGTQRLQNSFARVEVVKNNGPVAVETSNGAVDASDITGSLTIRDRFASLTVARVSNGVTLTNSNGAVSVTDSGGVGDIRNSFGAVTVLGFRGDLTVNNSNGKVEAENVQGSASLRTTFGDVRFLNIGRQLIVKANNAGVRGSKVGGAATITNSFGVTEISDAQREVHIESGNGSVTIERVGAAAAVRTSFGTVQATEVNGVLTVDNSNGAVKAVNTKGAQITTSFGPVILEGVSGPISVQNQNGTVEASSSLRGGCQPILMRTSFSPLRVRLQGDTDYRVSARTSFGKIRSEFPISVSGSMSSDELSGVLGSGRCELRLTDNNGSIEILK